jgi:hypothetical protein
MDEPETASPRRWTLTVCPDCGNEQTGFALCEHQRGGDGPTGIAFEKMLPVRVIEEEPVLDLVERLLEECRERFDGSNVRRLGEIMVDAEAVLRACGRLPKETSDD